MRAKLRYLRISARKSRLVVDLVRGKSVDEASTSSRSRAELQVSLFESSLRARFRTLKSRKRTSIASM